MTDSVRECSTGSAELLALAERVEKLTGPDRETDILIGYAVDLRGDDEHLTFRRSFDVCGMEQTLRMAESYQNIWREALPRYTASLDAAMTLAVERWRLTLERFLIPNNPSRYLRLKTWQVRLKCYVGDPEGNTPSYQNILATGTTPAIALTAGWLSARASQPSPMSAGHQQTEAG